MSGYFGLVQDSSGKFRFLKVMSGWDGLGRISSG